jgi:hypothetical protein
VPITACANIRNKKGVVKRRQKIFQNKLSEPTTAGLRLGFMGWGEFWDTPLGATYSLAATDGYTEVLADLQLRPPLSSATLQIRNFFD